MSFGLPASQRRRAIADAAACPCGSERKYGGCCGPLLAGQTALRAEALMRSRYTAFALGDVDHLLSSWHPGTRPRSLSVDDATVWTRLEILDVVEGEPGDRRGIVEFRAWYREPGSAARALHERSRFAHHSGRWWYLDGAVV